MAGVLAKWKTIQADNPKFRDRAKFKPDITPFCTKIDADARKFAELDEQKKKIGKIVDDAGVQIEARATKISARTDEVDDLEGDYDKLVSEDIDLTGEDAVKLLSESAASIEALEHKRMAAAQEIAKLSGEQANLIKSAAAQFKAKREGIDAEQKKLSADGIKMANEIKRLVGVYQTIAKGMKEPAMAIAIAALLDVDPG